VGQLALGFELYEDVLHACFLQVRNGY